MVRWSWIVQNKNNLPNIKWGKEEHRTEKQVHVPVLRLHVMSRANALFAAMVANHDTHVSCFRVELSLNKHDACLHHSWWVFSKITRPLGSQKSLVTISSSTSAWTIAASHVPSFCGARAFTPWCGVHVASGTALCDRSNHESCRGRETLAWQSAVELAASHVVSLNGS